MKTNTRVISTDTHAERDPDDVTSNDCLDLTMAALSNSHSFLLLSSCSLPPFPQLRFEVDAFRARRSDTQAWCRAACSSAVANRRSIHKSTHSAPKIAQPPTAKLSSLAIISRPPLTGQKVKLVHITTTNNAMHTGNSQPPFPACSALGADTGVPDCSFVMTSSRFGWHKIPTLFSDINSGALIGTEG